MSIYSNSTKTKPPLYGVVFIKSEKLYIVVLITFFMSPVCYCLPIAPPFSPLLLLHLPLLVHFSPSVLVHLFPLVFYLVRSLQAINSSATTCGFWLSLMRASILRT